jgi:hypothetical protein
VTTCAVHCGTSRISWYVCQFWYVLCVNMRYLPRFLPWQTGSSDPTVHDCHVKLIKERLTNSQGYGTLGRMCSTTAHAMRQGLILPSGNADPGAMTGHDDRTHQNSTGSHLECHKCKPNSDLKSSESLSRLKV